MMFDGVHRLWASVAVGIAALSSVTTMLIIGVDVTDIVAAFASLGLLINLYLVSEVAKVKQNTNGTIAEMQTQIRELTKHAQSSVSISEVATLVQQTGGVSNGR